MKNIVIMALFIAIVISNNKLNAAVKPDKIPSKLKEIKSNGWYQEKYEAWQAYLKTNAQDKSGWVEYFKAAQYAGLSQESLQEIAAGINEKFSGTSEDYLVQSKLNKWLPKGVEALERAVALAEPSNLLIEKAMMSEFNLDTEQRKKFSQQIYDHQLLYASSINYSYNVLMSVGDNGIIFTEGESTTIPIWMVQDVMNIRKDVKVINLELAKNEDYLQRKLSDLGLSYPTSVTPINPSYSIPSANPNADFFFALTLPRQRMQELEEKLYIVGLTSQLSNKRINNYEILQDNIENNFLLDYLTVDFNGEPKTATGKSFEGNYIVPFLLLKEYYDQTGNASQSAYWKEQLLEVAERAQMKTRVEILLEGEKATEINFKTITLDIKALDKQLTKVKGNLYASAFETSNIQYEIFLNYLKDNGYTDLYESANINLEDYEGAALSMRTDYHFNNRKTTKRSNEYTKKDYSNYPTLDLTHESAKVYCEWMTVQYNAQEKRKFKKVKFRLPTQAEWTMAALGFADFQSWVFEDNVVKARPFGEEKPKIVEEYRIGDYDSVSYPWFYHDWFKSRNSIVNDKGCYLANVKAPQVTTCIGNKMGDGFTFTNNVGAYFAGGIGLFDVIGNVAEMIDQKGIAMGGSWDHSANESTVTSVSRYEGSSPSVGFRFFMEVIEE